MFRPKRTNGQERPVGTNLNPIGITSLCISAAIILVIQMPKLLNTKAEDNFICSIIGGIIAICILVILPAYIVGRLSKSDKIYNIGILLVTLIFWSFIGSSIFGRIQERKNNEQVFAEFKDNSMKRDAISFLEDSIDGEVDEDAFIEQRESNLKRSKELVSKLEGRDKLLLEQALAVNEVIQKMQSESGNLAKELYLDQNLDFTSFKELQKLKDYKLKIEKWHKSNQKANNYIKNLKNIFFQRLNNLHLSDKDKNFLWGKLSSGMVYDQLSIIYQTDTDFSEAMLSICEKLVKEWGHWYINQDTDAGFIMFESDDMTDYYNAYLSKTQDIAIKQENAQKKIIERLKALQ
ncbi:hypothetical protein JD969_20055 [Planctomycetota bacterium]|nr:hypothetical protein JD969_20055 [Planctomycetota bacterium]